MPPQFGCACPILHSEDPSSQQWQRVPSALCSILYSSKIPSRCGCMAHTTQDRVWSARRPLMQSACYVRPPLSHPPEPQPAARGSSVWSPRQPKAEERLQNGRLGYGCLDISSFLEDRTLQTRLAQRRHPTGSLGLACGRRPSTFSFFWFVCWASLCTAKQMVVCFWLSFPAVWMWTVEFCLLKLQFVFLFWLHWIFRLFLGRVEHVYKIDIVKTSLSNVLFLWIQYII